MAETEPTEEVPAADEGAAAPEDGAAPAEEPAAEAVEKPAAEAAEPPAVEEPPPAAEEPPPAAVEEPPPAEEEPTAAAPDATQYAPPDATQCAPPDATQYAPMREETPSPPPVAAAPVDYSCGAIDASLLSGYVDGTKAAGRKVNHLVQRSLEESIQAATLFIEAPGNHKLVFTSRIGDEDMQIFTQVFGGVASALARLDLSYNLLTDEGAQQLASGLLGPRARSLRSLSLKYNSFGPAGCQAVCQALSRCPTLMRLDISGNQLGREGGMMVVDLLKVHPDLSELYLADTEIEIDVIVALCTTLRGFDGGPVPRLRLLDLENPRIQTLQEEHTVVIGRMLRMNTHLSEVRLGKLGMRDEGVRQLVSFLLENKTLRILDLRCNELGMAGAQHLGTLLASDCQLSQLNLSGNRIGERGKVDGAQALAQSLLSNRMLRRLDLNHNMLCGPALSALGEAVDQNSTLESVGLFHNEWDQPASYKFHQILHDRSRILPLRADFVTSEVDLRIDICKLDV